MQKDALDGIAFCHTFNSKLKIEQRCHLQWHTTLNVMESEFMPDVRLTHARRTPHIALDNDFVSNFNECRKYTTNLHFGHLDVE